MRTRYWGPTMVKKIRLFLDTHQSAALFVCKDRRIILKTAKMDRTIDKHARGLDCEVVFFKNLGSYTLSTLEACVGGDSMKLIRVEGKQL